MLNRMAIDGFECTEFDRNQSQSGNRVGVVMFPHGSVSPARKPILNAALSIFLSKAEKSLRMSKPKLGLCYTLHLSQTRPSAHVKWCGGEARYLE
jgi:hypothetical protein